MSKFLQQISTNESQVKSEISEAQTSISNLDKSQKMLYMRIQKVIECASDKNKLLNIKLVSSLANNQILPGTVHFQQPYCNSPSTVLHLHESLTKTQSKQEQLSNFYRIVYQCKFKYSNETLIQKDCLYFKSLTSFVHSQIININKTYKIENRVPFWVRQLDESIKKWHQKSYQPQKMKMINEQNEQLNDFFKK